MYGATIGARRYTFRDLANLLAKASPLRSGDQLAGLSADTDEERVAAQHVLADLPLATFLHEHVVPYETCEVTRLIVEKHDQTAFAPVAHLTVGGFRDWLLSDEATTPALAALAPGGHAGDGCGGQQNQPRAGLDGNCCKMLCGNQVPRHARPARPPVGAASAKPSNR